MPKSQSASRRLLLLAGEDVLRRTLRAVVEASGWAVEEACGVADGVELVRHIAPTAVLCARQLKTGTGLEALEALSIAAPDVPLVAWCPGERAKDMQASMRHGAWDHVSRAEEVVAVLEGALERTVRRHAGSGGEWEGIERERVEAALRESESRFGTVVENLTEGLVITDEADVVTYMNSRMAEMCGYRREELIGHPTTRMLAEHVKEPVSQKIFNRLHGVSETYETELQRHDGTMLWVEISAGPYPSADGRIIGSLSVVRDITERKRAAAEREKLESQLRRSQKMETIGTLAGGVAHDFNNILTPILGYGEMAKYHLDKQSPARADLEQIIQAAQRARDLVRQILTFSRQGDQERKPVLVQLIVKEALKLIRASLPATIEIREQIDGRCEPVLCEPTQIHQVLMNLCTNAYHAMQETGGMLEVKLGTVLVDKELSCLKVNLKEGKYARLTVTDTGCGMDRAVMERIFEPFFTTKNAGEGTGLGLSVVHGIVMAHGGEITVYSEPGQGTTFQVYLPCTDSACVLAENAEQLARGRAERVLFVDDEPVNVKMGQQMLTTLGYEVTTRTSSLEALEAFRADPEKFDLVVTDQTMPQMTGITLAKELQALRPELPIVLITGFSETVTAQNFRRMGFAGYLMKPLLLRDVAKTLRSVLDEAEAEKSAV